MMKNEGMPVTIVETVEGYPFGQGVCRVGNHAPAFAPEGARSRSDVEPPATVSVALEPDPHQTPLDLGMGPELDGDPGRPRPPTTWTVPFAAGIERIRTGRETMKGRVRLVFEGVSRQIAPEIGKRDPLAGRAEVPRETVSLPFGYRADHEEPDRRTPPSIFLQSVGVTLDSLLDSRGLLANRQKHTR